MIRITPWESWPLRFARTSDSATCRDSALGILLFSKIKAAKSVREDASIVGMRFTLGNGNSSIPTTPNQRRGMSDSSFRQIPPRRAIDHDERSRISARPLQNRWIYQCGWDGRSLPFRSHEILMKVLSPPPAKWGTRGQNVYQRGAGSRRGSMHKPIEPWNARITEVAIGYRSGMTRQICHKEDSSDSGKSTMIQNRDSIRTFEACHNYCR